MEAQARMEPESAAITTPLVAQPPDEDTLQIRDGCSECKTVETEANPLFACSKCHRKQHVKCVLPSSTDSEEKLIEQFTMFSADFACACCQHKETAGGSDNEDSKEGIHVNNICPHCNKRVTSDYVFCSTNMHYVHAVCEKLSNPSLTDEMIRNINKSRETWMCSFCTPPEVPQAHPQAGPQQAVCHMCEKRLDEKHKKYAFPCAASGGGLVHVTCEEAYLTKQLRLTKIYQIKECFDWKCSKCRGKRKRDDTAPDNAESKDEVARAQFKRARKGKAESEDDDVIDDFTNGRSDASKALQQASTQAAAPQHAVDWTYQLRQTFPRALDYTQTRYGHFIPPY